MCSRIFKYNFEKNNKIIIPEILKNGKEKTQFYDIMNLVIK